MLFILEGHDLSGKTTAAKRLGGELKLPIITPWADLSAARSSLTSISRTLLSVVGSLESAVILDRFVTSEYIYGPLASRETSYLDGLLSEWRSKSEMHVFNLSLPEAELRRRFVSRGDHLFDEATILEIRRRYLDLGDYLPDWVTYTMSDSYEALEDDIRRRSPGAAAR